MLPCWTQTNCYARMDRKWKYIFPSPWKTLSLRTAFGCRDLVRLGWKRGIGCGLTRLSICTGGKWHFSVNGLWVCSSAAVNTQLSDQLSWPYGFGANGCAPRQVLSFLTKTQSIKVVLSKLFCKQTWVQILQDYELSFLCTEHSEATWLAKIQLEENLAQSCIIKIKKGGWVLSLKHAMRMRPPKHEVQLLPLFWVKTSVVKKK